MVDTDLASAFAYPRRGDDAATLHAVMGGGPVVATVLATVAGVALAVLLGVAAVSLVVIPVQAAVGLFWLGYFVRVARRTLAGDPEPPALGGVVELVRDGLWGALVWLVYALPLVVLTVWLVTAVFGVPLLGGGPGDSLTMEDVAVAPGTAIVLYSLGVVVYGLVAAYLLPASLVAYAAADSVLAALSPVRLKPLVLSSTYALPWLAVASAGFFAYVAVGVLTTVLVGYLLALLLPVAYFYLGVAGFHAFALAYVAETGWTPGDEPSTAAAGRRPEDL